MGDFVGYLFWGFLVVYGIILWLMSPHTVTLGGFFKGEDRQGRPSSPVLLTMSIFISWIFAKSVTNAANLGAEFGIVGGVAYATYWLCIPLTGLVIYYLRKRFAATSLVSFLQGRYGKAAGICFSLAILIRLFNEVWSNSSVVAGYYGDSGTAPFIIAALLFTLITLLYSMRGGLRAAIITDALQTILFAVALIFILIYVLPHHTLTEFVQTGDWRISAGVDLLLVTALQLFSYGFHDPVLTDRGFISDNKIMLKAFCVSGILGFLAILAFSFIGIDATLQGMPLSSNVPAEVGRALGIGALLVMALIMISAASSTLDSSFASLSKLIAWDLPRLLGKTPDERARRLGIAVMIFFAIVGNLPMVLGTDILKATTISGTMIMGLAPVFILPILAPRLIRPTTLGFHLSFWPGIVLGFAYAFGFLPAELAIGAGKNGLLLAVNFYGLIICTLGYCIPGIITRLLKPDGGEDVDSVSAEEYQQILEREEKAKLSVGALE
jgi:Na+/proline symporter